MPVEYQSSCTWSLGSQLRLGLPPRFGAGASPIVFAEVFDGTSAGQLGADEQLQLLCDAERRPPNGPRNLFERVDDHCSPPGVRISARTQCF